MEAVLAELGQVEGVLLVGKKTGGSIQDMLSMLVCSAATAGRVKTERCGWSATTTARRRGKLEDDKWSKAIRD